MRLFPLFTAFMVSLAIYMGVTKADRILDNMQEAGIPMTLDVDIVSHASTRQERVLRCTLQDLPKAIAEGGVKNPAVIMISWPKTQASTRRGIIAA